MIKRLLNLHTIQKITLILTTLFLLMPNIMLAKSYITTGVVRYVSVQGSTYTHTWAIDNNNGWKITHPRQTAGITSSNNNYLPFNLNYGESMTLTTSKPTDGSGDFRKIILDGLDEKLSTTVTFGSKTLTSISTEVFAPESPIEWVSQDITITITNNQSEEISCTINSISFLTGTPGSATLTWADEATSPTGTNYDVSEIVKSVSGDNISLTGRCEQDATFRFQLYSSLSSHTINYSSSNTNVAEVDNNGIVTVKRADEVTITAVPQGDDNYYYLPSSYRLNITGIYQFCDLIVGGHRVTTGNSNNILKDDNHTVTFDGYQTLTLNGANLNGDGIISSRSELLTIKITGTNKITVSDPNEACIKSTNGGQIAFVKGNGGTENNLLLKHTIEGCSAIKEVSSITLESGLHTLPSSSPSEWIAKEKEIFITDKQIYDLNIAGIQVTEGNRNNIFNDTDFPTVSYDGNGTLTLKNAEIIGQISVGSSIANLTINLVGRSFLANSNTIQSFDVTNSTSISFTTSNDLPGSLQFNGNDNIFPETYSKTVSYNGMEYENGDYKILKKTIENLTVHTFKTSTYNNGSPTYNHKDVYDDKQRIFYATELANGHNEENGRIYIKASSSSKALSLFRRVNSDSFDDMSLISNVSLQFEWGKCTNTNVKVKVQEIEQGVSEITEGNDLSSWTDLPSEGRIVTINLTKAAKTNNIRLYFTSETDEFSFALLGVAYKSVEPYDLSFNNQFVSIINKDDIFGDGKASYDYENHILTLNGVNLVPNGPAEVAGWNYMGNQDLTVKLKGKNNITDALFYNRGNYPGLNIKFISEATEPGSLYMTNRSISNSSETFSDVKENFVHNFTVVYDNTYYDYSRYENNDGGYIGTYSVLPLQPTISSTYSSGKRYVSIDNPAASTISGTIKYSISYADGTEGITDATYSEPFPIAKPATITSYIIANGKNSATTTAYRLGITQNKVSLVYGAETEEFTYAYNPQVLPAVEGIEVQVINFSDYFASMDGDLYVRGVGKGDGLVMLSIPDLHDYTLLNDTTYFAFTVEVLPEKPTFNVDAGTYNQTQKVTLASPYNDPNNIANELGTGGSANINIKYYLGETKPEEPFTYTGPITISESTKLTAWVEVKYEIPVMIQDQPGGNQTMTEIYESEAVTKSYVIDRDIEKTTITLADDKTEFTYNEAANVPTITQVSLTDGTETLQLTADKDYTISYVKVNGETEEAIEASKIINAGSYKMILTGKGNFSGTKDVAFTITPRAITNLTFTLSATSFTYNGEAQKPTVTVQFKETELTASMGTTKTIPTTDYDLTFSGECINAGTYSVSASLKGNYSGSGDGPSFTITKATITPTVTLEGWTYGATGNEPSVTGNSGSGDVTYTYKPQHAAEEAYSATKPTNAGAYTVKASIAATANYEAATDSAHFTIAKAAGGLAYSTATASAELNGDGWTAPELKNPNSLAVTYTSSNTAVATISETGVVTLVGTGETTIKAASEGDANHEACEVQYTLTVSRGRALGYGVWVGETEVDEDNYIDILNDGEKDDDGEYTKAPSFIFNPKDTTLLIINSDAGMTIESRLPELKIHLSNDNKLKKIFFNNQGNSENTGKLLFTCDSNFPGSVTIGNTVGESAISGFASVSYEFNLQVLKPAKAKYANGQMTDSLGVVADTITVGVPLEPIKSDDKEELDSDDFTVTNSDGSTATLDLTSANVNNIYYTLPESTEGQGYDPETNTISVVDPMTDEAVEQIAAATTNNSTTVGSNDYAENFVGLTFIVQGGEGVIKIDQDTEDGYEFHLKIGDKPSIALKSGKEEIEYSLPDATYCWLYLVRKVALARGYTRVGKRDHIPGNIRLVKVQSKVVASTKSAAAASGGTVTPTVNLAITGIVDIDKETPESKYTVETVNDKWYTIDGRRIDKPTQKGLYIRNRKKIVVK